jgi:hypothetical protein
MVTQDIKNNLLNLDHFSRHFRLLFLYKKHMDEHYFPHRIYSTLVQLKKENGQS